MYSFRDQSELDLKTNGTTTLTTDTSSRLKTVVGSGLTGILLTSFRFYRENSGNKVYIDLVDVNVNTICPFKKGRLPRDFKPDFQIPQHLRKFWIQQTFRSSVLKLLGFIK